METVVLGEEWWWGRILPPGRHLTVFTDCHSVEVRGRGRAERRDGGGAAGIEWVKHPEMPVCCQ